MSRPLLLGLMAALVALTAAPALAQSRDPARAPVPRRVQQTFHTATESIRRDLRSKEEQLEQKAQAIMKSVCLGCDDKAAAAASAPAHAAPAHGAAHGKVPMPVPRGGDGAKDSRLDH